MRVGRPPTWLPNKTKLAAVPIHKWSGTVTKVAVQTKLPFETQESQDKESSGVWSVLLHK